MTGNIFKVEDITFARPYGIKEHNIFEKTQRSKEMNLVFLDSFGELHKQTDNAEISDHDKDHVLNPRSKASACRVLRRGA